MPDILTPSKETKLNAATTGPLRILGRANSFNVRKVLWVCDEIGIAYTREDFGRGFAPTNTADFLRLNPTGQVPVVIDGDHAMRESNTIAYSPMRLVVNRWFSRTHPGLKRPDYPAVWSYYELMTERPAFRRHGRNGLP